MSCSVPTGGLILCISSSHGCFCLNRKSGSLQDARDQECYKHFDIPKNTRLHKHRHYWECCWNTSLSRGVPSSSQLNYNENQVERQSSEQQQQTSKVTKNIYKSIDICMWGVCMKNRNASVLKGQWKSVTQGWVLSVGGLWVCFWTMRGREGLLFCTSLSIVIPVPWQLFPSFSVLTLKCLKRMLFMSQGQSLWDKSLSSIF